MKESFLISRPDQWLRPTHFMNMEDLREFFFNLEQVLKQNGYQYEITQMIKEIIPTEKILLAHHTYGRYDRVWHIKKGYIPGFIYFDRTGYSGWAEIANNQSLYEMSQQEDEITSRQFVESFVKEYAANNQSKMSQDAAFARPEGEYVFVVGQVPGDTVAHWANITSDELVVNVAKRLTGSKYRVVFKPHPIDYSKRLDYYTQLESALPITITHGSIHQIIPNASAVFTVNSGVGFESLLYGKRVICSGHSDYHWVTTRITDADDLSDIESLVETSLDTTPIYKFVNFMMNKYFIKSNSPSAIKNKILDISHNV